MKKEQIRTMEIITQLLDRTHVNCTLLLFILSEFIWFLLLKMIELLKKNYTF